jgi:orotate phosphoribosyltransferase
MNERENQLALTAVQLGLLRIAPEGQPFPGRNGGPSHEAIMDVRGAASCLPLRSFLLGGLLNEICNFPAGVIVGGVSRGGLVLGSQLALIAGRSFVTILPEGPRAAGLQRSIEGQVEAQSVILFDNVASSGSSLGDAARQVINAGGNVAGALVVGTYGTIPPLPFPLHVLLSFRGLIEAAHEAGIINNARRNKILSTI